MKLSTRAEKNLKAVLGVFVAIQILFTAGFAAHPPVGAAALILAGRGPACGFRASLQAFYRGWSTADLTHASYKKSTLVKSEGGNRLIATPWGQLWEPAQVGTAIAAQVGEIEAKYAGFPGQPIVKGDIVLDCGAKAGVETLYALHLGAAKVIAIEPSPANIAMLEKSFAQEIAEGRVIVYPKGVWETRESKAAPATIDKLVAELQLERVDFIRLDNEGAGRQALAGGRETIARFKPRMEISIGHGPGDPSEVPALAHSINPGYNISCLVCKADWSKLTVNSTILFFE